MFYSRSDIEAVKLPYPPAADLCLMVMVMVMWCRLSREFCKNRKLCFAQITLLWKYAVEKKLLQALNQEDYDGRGQQTASPMFTAIMSGGVGISGKESANTTHQLPRTGQPQL